jgi:hypothetical protein
MQDLDDEVAGFLRGRVPSSSSSALPILKNSLVLKLTCSPESEHRVACHEDVGEGREQELERLSEVDVLRYTTIALHSSVARLGLTSWCVVQQHASSCYRVGVECEGMRGSWE